MGALEGSTGGLLASVERDILKSFQVGAIEIARMLAGI